MTAIEQTVAAFVQALAAGLAGVPVFDITRADPLGEPEAAQLCVAWLGSDAQDIALGADYRWLTTRLRVEAQARGASSTSAMGLLSQAHGILVALGQPLDLVSLAPSHHLLDERLDGAAAIYTLGHAVPTNAL